MSQAILKTVKDRVKARLHNPNLSDTNVEGWVNDARDRMVRDIKPTFLNTSSPFTTIASTATYNVQGVMQESIKEIVDETNERTLVQVTEAELNALDPDRSDGSDSILFVCGNIIYVQNQPTAASTIQLVSTSALDVTQNVLVRGISSTSGQETTESKLLTGTVAVTTTTSFSSLIAVTLDATCVGTVTAKSNTAAVTNVSIPQSNLYVEYLPITLYGIPSTTGDVMRIYHYKALPALDNDSDPLFIPSEWVSLLVNLALVEAHRHGYEYQPSELLLKDIEDQIKAFSQKYQRSRKTRRSLVHDVDFDSCTHLNYTKPVG